MRWVLIRSALIRSALASTSNECHNRCFRREVRKMSILFGRKKMDLWLYIRHFFFQIIKLLVLFLHENMYYGAHYKCLLEALQICEEPQMSSYDNWFTHLSCLILHSDHPNKYLVALTLKIVHHIFCRHNTRCVKQWINTEWPLTVPRGICININTLISETF